MSLGDVFNGAFGYIRENPKATLGLSLIVMSLAAVLPALGSGMAMNDLFAWEEQFDPAGGAPSPGELFPYSMQSLLILLAGWLLSFMGMIVLTGLLTGVVAMAVLGRRLTMGEAWNYARGRLPALAGLMLLLALAAILWMAFLGGMIALGAFLMAAVDPVIGVLIIAAGVLSALPLGVWLYVKFALAAPPIIVERAGPLGGIARSWRLVSGNWWRVFGILLLATMLVYLVSMVLALPFDLVGVGMTVFGAGEAGTAVVLAATTFVATVLGTTITYPFISGVTALLYVDMRIRREGLDMRLQTAAASGESVEDVYRLAPSSGSHGGGRA